MVFEKRRILSFIFFFLFFSFNFKPLILLNIFRRHCPKQKLIDFRKITWPMSLIKANRLLWRQILIFWFGLLCLFQIVKNHSHYFSSTHRLPGKIVALVDRAYSVNDFGDSLGHVDFRLLEYLSLVSGLLILQNLLKLHNFIKRLVLFWAFNNVLFLPLIEIFIIDCLL